MSSGQRGGERERKLEGERKRTNETNIVSFSNTKNCVAYHCHFCTPLSLLLPIFAANVVKNREREKTEKKKAAKENTVFLFSPDHRPLPPAEPDLPEPRERRRPPLRVLPVGRLHGLEERARGRVGGPEGAFEDV